MYALSKLAKLAKKGGKRGATAHDYPPHTPTSIYTAAELERRTRGQSSNPEWAACRYGRVTESVCGKVMRAATYHKDQHGRFMLTIAEAIVNPRAFSSAATRWGIEHEDKAIDQYFNQRVEERRDHVVSLVRSGGIAVSADRPWLGYSPDAVVYEAAKETPTNDEDQLPSSKRQRLDPQSARKILLEVKCPYSQRNNEKMDLSSFYMTRSSVDGTCALDMKKVQARNYYYQVQLGMALMDIDVAHLQPRADELAMLATLSDFHTRYVEPKMCMDKYRRVVTNEVKELVRVLLAAKVGEEGKEGVVVEASDGYTTIIIDDTAVPALLSPIQDPPSPASSDSEDEEPLTLKRPSLVMPSDSEDDEPAPSHLPVPPPLLVSLPLSPPTPPTPGVPDEMPAHEAVTAALETFLLGSSVGAEVEVGGDEFAEAAGMVDAIVERLADPPTPSAPSAPSPPRKRKNEEKRRERKAGKGASSKLKRR
ncbi:hypothetical protein CAPTEDRAFT_199475 [Capitella teleta]|uniref:YqaJ viral recombinase domain-containing protein n=1 Tax=Capitella teleta TaxID=283909 RepID=R7T4A6_CAPTE|nr:hypothetical protein CAPTEDRAFT_199475 [Capitella teleta]|eukprot:ELT87792.1 hypothetical protein CAPTEDRAFT_199475 [Capitella teleta]